MFVELHAQSAFSFLEGAEQPERSWPRRRGSGCAAGPGRPRRPLRRRPLPPGGRARRCAPADRQRADSPRRLPPARARRGPRGLPQPLPADHPDEARRAQGRGRASTSTSSPPTRLGSSASPAAPTVRWPDAWLRASIEAAQAVPRPAGWHLRRRQLLRGGPAPPRSRPGAPAGGAWCGWPARARAAARRHQPAALLRSCGGRAVADRAPGQAGVRWPMLDLHPREDHAGRGRPPPGPERRARAQARVEMAQRVPRSPRGGHQHRRAGAAPGLHAEGSRLPLPRLSAAAGHDRARAPARAGRARGARGATAEGRWRRRRAGQIAHELDIIGRLDLAGYFLIVWDIVEFCRAPRHPGAGAGLGRQQRGVLRARHHRRRSGGHGPALRALPLRGARRVARHRPRPAERRAAGGGHPVRLSALRPPRRRP